MRVIARRHKVRIGDRLVGEITIGPRAGQEGVSAPIITIGEESVVLADGSIVPLPSDQAVYLEREVVDPLLTDLEDGDDG